MNSEFLSNYLHAGSSACLTYTFTYPIDIWKFRDQFKNINSNKLPTNFLHYYKGFVPNLGLTFLEKGIKISTYKHFTKDNKFSAKAAIYSGLVQGLLNNPIEMIKIKRQVSAPLLDVSFYRGLHLTYARDIPFNLLFFGISDKFNNIYSSLFAGIFATSLVTPIDVIKTRYQENDKSVIDIFKKTKTNEIFYGLKQRVISVGVFYGLTYTLFKNIN